MGKVLALLPQDGPMMSQVPSIKADFFQSWWRGLFPALSLHVLLRKTLYILDINLLSDG